MTETYEDGASAMNSGILARIARLENCLDLVTTKLVRVCNASIFNLEAIKAVQDQTRMVASVIRSCERLFALRTAIEDRGQDAPETRPAGQNSTMKKNAPTKQQENPPIPLTNVGKKIIDQALPAKKMASTNRANLHHSTAALLD